MAPLSLMVFAVVRDLDAFGSMLASRSYNFADIPLAITAGVGLAYIVASLSKHARQHAFFKPVPAFAVAIFIMLCAMSLPLAYGGQEAFGGQPVTRDYEMSAMEWTAQHGAGNVVTDQRLGDIIDPYYGMVADRTGPWKIKAGAVGNSSLLLVSDSWTEIGAQMHPLENIMFTDESLSAFLDNCNVCYTGGPRGSKMIVALYMDR
jgi:hypothetical protein